MRNFFNFYKLLSESAFPSDPNELERILKKYRLEISDIECSNQIKELLKLKDNRTKINCFEWMKKGTVRLPEDLPKVEQALKIAKNKNLNPKDFKSPQELINKYSTFSQGAELINPDDVPEFSNKEKKGNGVVVYDVEDSDEGQMAVRKVLNNNYGKDFNPWCLAYSNSHNGVSKDAKEYWEYYDAFQKKIAFQNGKAIAFQADDEDRKKAIEIPRYGINGITLEKMFDSNDFSEFWNDEKVEKLHEKFIEKFGQEIDEQFTEEFFSEGFGWRNSYDVVENLVSFANDCPEIFNSQLDIEDEDRLSEQYALALASRLEPLPDEARWWDLNDEPHEFLDDIIG